MKYNQAIHKAITGRMENIYSAPWALRSHKVQVVCWAAFCFKILPVYFQGIAMEGWHHKFKLETFMR